MEKDHLEILLEDMNGKFDLVLEGHEGLRNDMRRLEKRLGKKIDLNAAKIEALADHTNERFNSMEHKLEALDEKLSNRIDVVNCRLDSVEQNLGSRIDAVEKNLGSRIDAVAADLAAHRRDTEVHGGYQVSEIPPEK